VEETLPSGKQCFFAKKYDSDIHIVITSNDYPFWLAVECIDELSGVDIITSETATPSSLKAATSSFWMSNEEKYRKWRQHCIHIFTKYSKNEPGCVLYDMRIMEELEAKENQYHSDNDDAKEDEDHSSSETNSMIPYSREFWKEKKAYVKVVERYLQAREEEARQQKIKEAIDQVEEIKNQMEDAIAKIEQQNMAQAKRLKERGDQLLQQAKLFRKSAKVLKEKVKQRYSPYRLVMVGTTVVLASAGGAVALAVGDEGLAMAAGAMLAGVFGFQVSDAVTANWFYSLPRLVVRSWIPKE
jgi:hypothetical protein